MRFLDWIVEYLWDIGDWFWEAYQEVEDWIWPFSLLADPLYEIQRIFGWLSWEFADFSEWVRDAADKIRDILDFGDIWDYFRTWFEYAEDAWDWVSSAFSNVVNIIDTWWDNTKLTVQAWIDIAVEGLAELREDWDTFWTVTFPEWTGKLDSLKAAWDDFWMVIFPTLVSFGWLSTWWDTKLIEINSLIDTALKSWFPFYDDLVKLWKDIELFFTNPFQWLETKFTNWFLGEEK